MSFDEPSRPSIWEKLSKGYLIYMAVTPLILFLILGLVLALRQSIAPTTNSDGGGASRPTKESGVETAARSLTRQTDLTTIRNALQQINSELNDNPALHPPPLTKEQKDWLGAHIGLSGEELAEVENVHYTRLDGHHLDTCFLLRDAANAQEVKGVRGKGGAVVVEKPLDRAARAFAWVMRQVRLRERENEGAEAPPAFVLRRGYGNALERALVFLALLEQSDSAHEPRPEFIGCLLETPTRADHTSLWACGVVVGDEKDVYLFDPRLGLPLPGPKGEGIATLAQARQQPEILAQLNVDKFRYPVTMEQARAARAQLVCPLSALSPRMRYLQDKLLAPTVRVRLADDAAKEQERLQAACAAGAGKPTPLILSSDKITLLRRFMPVEEGGVDTSYRKDRLTLNLVPWKVLPSVFLDETKFPPKIGLGQQVRKLFASPFIHTMMDAGFARDLLLRGRYRSSVEALVSERDRWRNQVQQRASAVDLEKKADEWFDEAIRIYALQVRAKLPRERAQAELGIKTLWDDKHAWPIYLLINSAAAAARTPEVAYQLGLCSQEQAEQVQARLDVETPAGGAAAHRLDVEKARQAWQTALNNWKLLEEDYPNHPDRAAARRLRGRAEALLGEREAALASWKDDKGYKNDLEKIASLLLAQQLEKSSGKDKR